MLHLFKVYYSLYTNCYMGTAVSLSFIAHNIFFSISWQPNPFSYLWYLTNVKANTKVAEIMPTKVISKNEHFT